MQNHVHILGWLYIVFNALSLVAGALLFLVLFGAGVLAQFCSCIDLPESGQLVAGLMLVVGTVIASFLVLVSLPGVIGGIGLLKRRPWARILVIVLGVLNLLEVPFGTALGAYTLWVLLRQDGATLFPEAPTGTC